MASQSYLREAKSYAVSEPHFANLWGMWVATKAYKVSHTSVCKSSCHCDNLQIPSHTQKKECLDIYTTQTRYTRT